MVETASSAGGGGGGPFQRQWWYALLAQQRLLFAFDLQYGIRTNMTANVEKHNLNTTWAVFEHKDWSKYTKIATFNTVEDFWGVWDIVPAPSAFFFNGKAKNKISGRDVEGFSIFREGIKPEWEDPMNASGGELFIRTSEIDLAAVDKYWENLALTIIGENSPVVDKICGIRVVDKSKKNSRTNQYIKHAYRLDVWYKQHDEQSRKDVEALFLECLTDLSSKVNIEWKPHSTG